MPTLRASTGRRDPLLVRVCTELGRGHITEARIVDANYLQCDGFTAGGPGIRHITINPIHETVDTLIHELLHRLYPSWTERYVRNRTGRLRRTLTDAEIQAIYDEYSIQVKRRKTPRVVTDDD